MQNVRNSSRSNVYAKSLPRVGVRETLIKGFMAGLMIAVGGTAFLSSESRVVGALLFTLGLITICNMGYLLITGKVCYALENGPEYVIKLILITLSNFIACVLYGAAIQQYMPQVAQKAAEICQGKLLQAGGQSFFLGVMCGILMYVAVDTYRRQEGLSRYIGIVTCVPGFILCGFEHSVADAVYLGMAGLPEGSVPFLLVVLAGNAVGGLLFPALQRMAGEKQ